MYENYVYMFPVHRDIKPSNLLVVKNKSGTFDVKVSDFGIAKDYAPTSKPHMTTGIGTENWRAREQLLGRSRTPADVS